MLIDLRFGLKLTGTKVATLLRQIGIGQYWRATLLGVTLLIWLILELQFFTGDAWLYAVKFSMAITPELKVRRRSLQLSACAYHTDSIVGNTFFCLAAAVASAFRFLALASASLPGFTRPSFSAAAAA